MNKLCCGCAVLSRQARQDLRCAFAELVHGVDVSLILDQFGGLITCPIQEGDGADLHSPIHASQIIKSDQLKLSALKYRSFNDLIQGVSRYRIAAEQIPKR